MKTAVVRTPVRKKRVAKIAKEEAIIDEIKPVDAALHYAELGHAVEPVCSVDDETGLCTHETRGGKCRKKGKRPMLTGWQTPSVGATHVKQRFAQFPEANVGLVCLDDLRTLDLDSCDAFNWAKENGLIIKTPIIKSSRGFNLLYRDSDGVATKTSQGKLHPKVDYLGQDHLVIVPPSVHATGHKYGWVEGFSLDDVPIAPIPQKLVALIEQLEAADSAEEGSGPTKSRVDEICTGVAKGERNSACTTMAGRYLWEFDGDEIQTKEALLKWNELNETPLPKDEVLGVLGSVIETARRKDGATAKEIGPLPTTHFTKIKDVKVRWLIFGLVPANTCGFITAPPAHFKSFISLDMAVAVATGLPFMDQFAVEQGPVVIFNGEDNSNRIKDRLLKLLKPRGVNLNDVPIYILDVPQLMVDDAEQLKRLHKTLDEIKPILLVLDPLVTLHSQNEDSATGMAPVLRAFRGIQRCHECAVVVAHHDKKSHGENGGRRASRMRGSGSIEGFRDWLLMLDEVGGAIKVQSYVKFTPPQDPWKFEAKDVEDGIKLVYSALAKEKTHEEKVANVKEKIVELLKAHPAGESRSALTRMVRVSKKLASLAVSELLEEGVVVDGNKVVTKSNGATQTISVVKIEN